MAIEDLTSALKNAIDHGESPAKAAASLINAGYSKSEVNAAIQIVSQMAAAQPKKIFAKPLPLQAAQQIKLLQRPQLQKKILGLPKSGRKNKILSGKNVVVAMMVIVSLLILLLMGILFAILFG